MINLGNESLGKLVLRLGIGGLMLFHGIFKIQNGVGGIEYLLDQKGLPTALAYGTYVGEVLAPVLLIVGFQTRLSALVLAGTMGMAIFLAHGTQLGDLDPKTGAWAIELPMLFLVGAAAIFFLGAGRFSIDGLRHSSE
jgi:putative oxidoreductase